MAACQTLIVRSRTFGSQGALLWVPAPTADPVDLPGAQIPLPEPGAPLLSRPCSETSSEPPRDGGGKFHSPPGPRQAALGGVSRSDARGSPAQAPCAGARRTRQQLAQAQTRTTVLRRWPPPPALGSRTAALSEARGRASASAAVRVHLWLFIPSPRFLFNSSPRPHFERFLSSICMSGSLTIGVARGLHV